MNQSLGEKPPSNFKPLNFVVHMGLGYIKGVLPAIPAYLGIRPQLLVGMGNIIPSRVFQTSLRVLHC